MAKKIQLAGKSILLTILGFIGFGFGCFIFFYSRGKIKSGFHEVQYNPQDISMGLLNQKRESIESLVWAEIKSRARRYERS